ncbi:IS110 family transposase [Carnobacterium maltaromaticum]|uniref:IS110 family transposase n=1 Tax=Carnobacterium maltaromaticum TaxID=2751 RepID=UPI0018CC9D44|nr:transposase [Carnobacterium maltaromaticum]
MLFVGIDIAKNKHDICILDSLGSLLVKQLTISNTKEGFMTLHNQLSKLLAETGDKATIKSQKMDLFHTLLVDEVMRNKTAKDIYKILVKKSSQMMIQLLEAILKGSSSNHLWAKKRMKPQKVVSISRYHLVQLLYKPVKSPLTKRQLALVFSYYTIVEKIIESIKQFRQLIKAKKSGYCKFSWCSPIY